MAFSISTSIEINATPSQVWNVLTDFEKYPEWNPFVRSLKGKVTPGNTIEVDLPGMKFRPKVLTFERNKEFSWQGHLFFKGLFDGEHIFRLFSDSDNITILEHSENFNGILVPFFKKKLLTDTKTGFEKEVI